MPPRAIVLPFQPPAHVPTPRPLGNSLSVPTRAADESCLCVLSCDLHFIHLLAPKGTSQKLRLKPMHWHTEHTAEQMTARLRRGRCCNRLLVAIFRHAPWSRAVTSVKLPPLSFRSKSLKPVDREQKQPVDLLVFPDLAETCKSYLLLP